MNRTRRTVLLAALFLAALSLAAGVMVVLGRGAAAEEPPAMTVEAVYPGATASVVEDKVAVPIEQQIEGVEHLRRLRSRCGSDGAYSLEVTFAPGTDLNLAQVLVQNRIGVALPALPAEIQRLGVTVRKPSTGLLMLICLVSPDARYDASYLSMYATLMLKDELARVPGVSRVSVLGAEDFPVRIRLDPEKLAARNLTVADVTRAVERQEIEAKAGPAAGPGESAKRGLDARGAPPQPEQFGKIVIKADPQGQVIRLRDVTTRLEIGVDQPAYASLDGKPVAMLAVYPFGPSHPRDVSDWVGAKLAELRQRFPDGIDAFAEFDFSRPATAEAPGYLLIDVDPRDGARAESTASLLRRGEAWLRKLPGVRNVLALSERPFDRDREQPCLVVGLGPAKGAAVDRERLIREVRTGFPGAGKAASIRVRDLSGAARSLRSGYPIHFAIAGPDRARVQELAGQLAARLSQDRRLTDVWAGPRPAPAPGAEIDRAKAATMGLPLADISVSIQAVFGYVQAGNFTGFDRTWPVWVQVDSGGRTEIDAFNSLMVRTDKGQMVPLRGVAALRRANESARLERLDLLPAVAITASLVGDLSPAEARFLCERRAAEVLPKQRPEEYRLVWLREMPAARPPAGPDPPPAAVVAPSVSPRRAATVP